MMLSLAVHVNAEGEIFAGLEQINFFFQQQSIGAEVDIFFACD